MHPKPYRDDTKKSTSKRVTHRLGEIQGVEACLVIADHKLVYPIHIRHPEGCEEVSLQEERSVNICAHRYGINSH